MKSALANIGETKLSSTASRLEQAGEKREIDIISSDTPAFIAALRSLVKKYKQPETGGAVELSHGDTAFLQDRLQELKAACGAFNKKAAKAALDDLKSKKWPQTTSVLLEEISVYLLRGEFKKIVSAIDEAE